MAWARPGAHAIAGSTAASRSDSSGSPTGRTTRSWCGAFIANIQFDRGDYRAARTLYGGLATDAADADVALRCRRQEATCAALAGDTAAAVRLFGAVLQDARRRYGDDDPQVVELRREIALLDPNG